ncbi:hypothetical protein [Pedobacter punctiformis]|uniref:Uncharacterized protein n=1 Tax=Pedobacter punctiformis TaxID=3004097 RepID=A0ABT4LDF8_9SPHI|nr:hypothetical protein [Pedobacter sp. HCMS5-2]MCZ4245935.1 hypothetical protein [Pedobacter sp. HCMS5-2]
MKRYLFLISFLTFSVSVLAQVKTGIGTRDPQQTLHVALPAGTASSSTLVGSTGVKLVTPTIRVEGLNSANNTANPGGINALKRVYTNQEGDLVLVNDDLEYQNIAQEFGEVIPTAEIVGLVGSGNFQSIELKSKTFTLTQPSVVYFSATFAALIRETSIILPTGPVTTTDKQAKLFGGYFQFSSASNGVSTTATFGNNRKTYSNASGTPLGVAGDFFLNPRAKLVLQPGTYTVKLYGELYLSTLGLLGRAQFGGTANENFIISAVPVKFQ